MPIAEACDDDEPHTVARWVGQESIAGDTPYHSFLYHVPRIPIFDEVHLQEDTYEDPDKNRPILPAMCESRCNVPEVARYTIIRVTSCFVRPLVSSACFDHVRPE